MVPTWKKQTPDHQPGSGKCLTEFLHFGKSHPDSLRSKVNKIPRNRRMRRKIHD